MSGIFSDSGIFGSSGIFSGDGIFSRGGVFDAPSFVDPLAGIPFDLRLQTQLGDGMPFGIDPDAGSPNPTWVGIIGTASQATEANQPDTQYVVTKPYLDFDGTNDFFLTDLQSSSFDAEGSIAVAFKRGSVTDYATVIGGTTGGPALVADSVADSWGLGAIGVYGPQGALSTNGLDCVMVARWSGSAYKVAIFRSDGTEDSTTGTLPSPFSSAAGVIGIGVHSTGSPYSYFGGRIFAVFLSNIEWGDSDSEKISNYLATLHPLPEQRWGALGDSNTDGSELPSPSTQSAPIRMKAAKEADGIPTFMLVAGVSGSTSGDWNGGHIVSVMGDLTGNNVTDVVIMLGTNDAQSANAVSKATYKENMLAICEDLLAEGITPWLNAPPYPAPGGLWDAASAARVESYIEALEELATEEAGIMLGDISLYAYTSANPSSLSDGIHLSISGADYAGKLWNTATLP